MTIYYGCINQVRGGFFDTKDHGEIGSPGCSIPSGAREITDEVHRHLIEAQSVGKLIVPDPAGYPIAIDPPPPGAEELAAIERAWRDARLAETDGVVSRHRDEQEEGVETTLSADQYAELQAYRRALRNWPDAGEFPLIDHRPQAPEWLLSPLQ
ncbi:phage tail assembly chaperone [Pseudomonas frederiksbergensis]|uniref:Phage tail protein n=1 Tax=Pseudomonas frederiksbergensis TaxID=104087 RepID=A0A423HS19_9PSED|nr:phage tail assembly chaperone [Pseudomonas frederiksbergensis]RON16040.1 phage tail protein [Pseudomonas frederiksbergensis]